MSKKQKKQQREAAIKAENAKRENDRLARSPLDKEQMLELFRCVGSNIVRNGHEHDFSNTDKWLSENGFDLNVAHEFFESVNIGDDWELLSNGDPFSLFGSSSTRHVWMPLEEDELNELIDYIETKLEESDCDHKLRFTEEWISGTDYDADQVKAALLAQGGYCEVMYNVESEGIYV